MNYEASFISVNGLRLRLRRYVNPMVESSGYTLLLLHGYLDSGATWDRVAPMLASAGHNVLAPDLRGYGDSEWIGAGGYYHFPDYVSDVAEMVSQLSPAKLGIVAHSMGGSIGCLYAGAFPGKAAKLAVLEGLGPPSTEPTYAVDRMQAWLSDLKKIERTSRPIGTLDQAFARLKAHHPSIAEDVLRSRVELLTRINERGERIWAYDPLHRTTSPSPFNAEAFKAFLKRITCPTLFVSGGPTGWHVPDEMERMRCVANHEFAELFNAGHMMHWSEPEALCKVLCSFFAK